MRTRVTAVHVSVWVFMVAFVMSPIVVAATMPFLHKPVLHGAHRGGSDVWPENTLFGFTSGADLWPDMLLECDARLTTDGYVVLIHDETVDRTTNGSGAVASKTLAQIQQLDAAYWFGSPTYPYRGQGITIPTLAEVLAALPDPRFEIELKVPSGQDPNLIADAAIAVIQAAGAVDRVLLASYTPEAMNRVRALDPNIATCYDTNTGVAMLTALRIGGATWDAYVPTDECLSLDTGDVTAYGLTDDEIHAIQAKGVRFQIHTLDSTSTMLDWMERGADSILTDKPDLLSTNIGTWLAPMGAVGDDLTDEYATSPDGGTGQNWVEHLVGDRSMNFGSFSASSRGEPRRAGYEYNWPRVGATSATLLTQGQHTGLAGQITGDEVHLAYLAVGLNDFAPPTVVASGKYRDIYDGTLAGQDLIDFLDDLEADVTTAIDALLAASPGVKTVIATIPDYGYTPYVRQGWAYDYSDPVKRQRVSDAIEAANARITAVAADRSIPVADLYAVVEAVYAAGSLWIGGVAIDLVNAGDDPDHMYCADGVHPGTVPQGLFANEFINAMNVYGIDVSALTEQEIWPGSWYALTVTVVKPQYGHVDLVPEPADPNQPEYASGAVITLTAEPNEGKSFKRWKLFDPNYPGDANHITIDTNNPVTIVMDADRELKAIFKCGGGGMAEAVPLWVIGLALCGFASRRMRRRG